LCLNRESKNNLHHVPVHVPVPSETPLELEDDEYYKKTLNQTFFTVWAVLVM